MSRQFSCKMGLRIASTLPSQLVHNPVPDLRAAARPVLPRLATLQARLWAWLWSMEVGRFTGAVERGRATNGGRVAPQAARRRAEIRPRIGSVHPGSFWLPGCLLTMCYSYPQMKKILVVDDEPKIVRLARDYLEH